ncbi:Interferon induced with helicase C domain 1 [Branchiostoma belcheri]|nr:Interferon induced with helicase C domain 1 [Branchiostoma belcheri]
MEERHREILTTHHAEIVRDLRVADVIAELIGRKIVSPRQNEILQALVLRGEEQTATAKLLAIVKSKGPQAFSIFCEVLREEYPHLADLLEAADRERVQAVEPERAELDVYGLLDFPVGVAGFLIEALPTSTPQGGRGGQKIHASLVLAHPRSSSDEGSDSGIASDESTAASRSLVEATPGMHATVRKCPQ